MSWVPFSSFILLFLVRVHRQGRRSYNSASLVTELLWVLLLWWRLCHSRVPAFGGKCGDSARLSHFSRHTRFMKSASSRTRSWSTSALQLPSFSLLNTEMLSYLLVGRCRPRCPRCPHWALPPLLPTPVTKGWRRGWWPCCQPRRSLALLIVGVRAPGGHRLAPAKGHCSVHLPTSQSVKQWL